MLISVSSNKKRTPDQVAKLPTFSLAVAESAYRLTGTIYIDNVGGLGATPDNQNVLYKGCMTMMSPATYLNLAKPDADVGERVPYLQDKVDNGYGFGCPCLYLNIDEFVDGTGGLAVVEGHEGRARMEFLKKSGIHEVPTQLLFVGYRARHAKSDVAEFTKWMNHGIRNENNTKTYEDAFKEFLFG